MNKAILIGRFTRDPEVRYTDGGTSIARFTIAVDRRFKKTENSKLTLSAVSHSEKLLSSWRSILLRE